MSWLTDIAGKAENFLNKIDQNAAVALSQAKTNGKSSRVSKGFKTDPQVVVVNDDESGQVSEAIYSHVSSSLSTGGSSEECALKKDEVNHFLNGSAARNQVTSVADEAQNPILPKDTSRSTGGSRKSNKSARSKSPKKEAQSSKLSTVPTATAGGPGAKPDGKDDEAELLNFLNDSSRKELDEKVGLQNELATQTREFQLLMSNNRQLQSENDSLKKKLIELEAQTKRKQASEEQSELLQAKEEIEEINSLLKKKELESAQLKQSLDHTLEKMKQLEVLRDSQNKLEFLEMEKQNLTAENDQMKNEIANYSSQFDLFESTVQAVKNSLAAVEYEFASYKEKAKSILKQKDEMISSLQSDSGISRLQSDSENGNENPFLPEIESLKSERELLNAEISQSRATVESLKDEVRRLESDIVTNRSLVSQLQRQLTNEKRTSSTLQEEALQLRQQVSVLQFEVEKERNDSRKLTESLNRKNDEMNRSPRATPFPDQRHTSTGQPDSEDNLRMRITALSQTLLEKQSLINNLSADKQLLQIKVERLQDEMRQLGNEQSARSAGFSHTVVSNQPLYLSESPWDSGVSTSFKRAFSTVDSLCCQAGLALRRRPNLRLGFTVYIIMLHLWVFFILFHNFNHAPNPNSDSPMNNFPSPAP